MSRWPPPAAPRSMCYGVWTLSLRHFRENFDSRLEIGRRALIRRILSDGQWERVAPRLPGKPGDPGRSGQDNRGFVEAVLWIARTGAPWRDLHPEFGRWNSIFRRFRRWAAKVFSRFSSRRYPTIRISN